MKKIVFLVVLLVGCSGIAVHGSDQSRHRYCQYENEGKHYFSFNFAT